jgi:hypothetical protein
VFDCLVDRLPDQAPWDMPPPLKLIIGHEQIAVLGTGVTHVLDFERTDEATAVDRCLAEGVREEHLARVPAEGFASRRSTNL